MKTICFVIFCLTLPLTVQGQEWPSFRGANAAGVNDRKPLPTVWNAESGQNIKWKTAIAGLGHSSPVVWGNKIF